MLDISDVSNSLMSQTMLQQISFYMHNFAQVQVYPWDKFLRVILLVLKGMCIWNFVTSCQIAFPRGCTNYNLTNNDDTDCFPLLLATM